MPSEFEEAPYLLLTMKTETSMLMYFMNFICYVAPIEINVRMRIGKDDTVNTTMLAIPN